MVSTVTISKIKKRDGRIVPFDRSKIEAAIGEASNAAEEQISKVKLVHMVDRIVENLERGRSIPTVEQVQDEVEKQLIADDFAKTAKAYILYRNEHAKIREAKGDLMHIYDELTFKDAKDADIKRENANIDADTAMGTMLKYGSEGAKYYVNHYILPKDIAKAHMEGDIHIHDEDFYMLTETCCQIDLLKLFHGGFCTGHGTLREPNDIRSYAALACIAIQANQNEMHGGQSIPNFDYCMAPGVAKTFRKQYLYALSNYFQIAKGMADTDADALVKEAAKGIPDKITMGSIDHFGKSLMKWLPEHQKKHSYVPINSEEAEKAHSYAAETALKKTDHATYEAMEALVHNLNTMNSRAGAQVPFSSLNYGTDTSPEGRMAMKNLLLATDAGLGAGETPIFPVQIFKVKEGVNYNPGDPNYDLFKLAIKVSAKRLFPNFSFLDAPFNLQYYKPGDYNTEVAYMGCLEGNEVITYRFRDITYVEGIGRAYRRLKQCCMEKSNGMSKYLVTDGIISTYDSYSKGFVNCKKMIQNPDRGNWYWLKFTNGRHLLVTADHPLPVLGKGRTAAKEMEIGDKVPVSLSPNHIPVDFSTDTDLAWLLGLILCDGCYQSTLTISLGMDEKDIADKLQKIIEKYGYSLKKIYQHRGKKGNYIDCYIKSGKDHGKIMSKFDDLFGGVNKTERCIPHQIFNAPEDVRASFLAGMLDADGYICHRAGDNSSSRFSLGSTNKELALQQMFLAQSVNLDCYNYVNHYKAGSQKIRFINEFAINELILKYMASGKKNKVALNCKTVKRSAPLFVSLTEKEVIGSMGKCSYDVETDSDHFDVSGLNSHNCRTRVIGNIYDPNRQVTCGRGNLSFTSINLPRLGIEAHGDVKKFYAILDERIDLVIRQLLHRFKIQCFKKVYNYPFLMGQGVWIDSEKLKKTDSVAEVLKHGTLSVGFIGLAECLKALTGKHHGESEESQKLGLEIVGHMRKRVDEESKKRHLNFTLFATPAEGLSGLFTKIDKQKYGIIPGVTDREYYTNSFHIPVYYPISAFKKIKLEAPYHALTNAGHITYVELDGDTSKNLDAFEAVVRCMKESGVGYGAINHPVDRDPVCGYNGIIDNECPKCHRKEDDGGPKFERIRRITGYLVGTMDRWNDAKRAEERDRVKHGLF